MLLHCLPACFLRSLSGANAAATISTCDSAAVTPSYQPNPDPTSTTAIPTAEKTNPPQRPPRPLPHQLLRLNKTKLARNSYAFGHSYVHDAGTDKL
ncbi:hypothetical protein C8J56DRAFT_975256 [Mycena floridula]|nr:hypothetical protein C8J56DRAFT_975256 [Mycena floridula]